MPLFGESYHAGALISNRKAQHFSVYSYLAGDQSLRALSSESNRRRLVALDSVEARLHTGLVSEMPRGGEFFRTYDWQINKVSKRAGIERKQRGSSLGAHLPFHRIWRNGAGFF